MKSKSVIGLARIKSRTDPPTNANSNPADLNAVANSMTSGIARAAEVTTPAATLCGDKVFMTAPSLDVVPNRALVMGILR